MSFPTYRQDFETGSTLATACPELVDLDSAYAIDTVSGDAFTGAHSLKLSNLVGNHTIISNVTDSLLGDVTCSVYLRSGSTSNSLSLLARSAPSGVTPTSFQRVVYGATGLSLIQDASGTVTTLNTPISGFVEPIGLYVCLEIRCHGTAITTRLVRQDTGQFFVNSGSGSWSSSPPAYDGTNSGTASLAAAAGAWGLRLGDSTFCNADDLIVDPAVPQIDMPVFTLSGVGATRGLTAGGFTDPLFGVTWGSSNAGVATVNSSTGQVTAVGPGSATITATGKRDSGQTATATATVTIPAATTYTFVAPNPPQGFQNSVSASFTVTPNGTYTGNVTITPSGGGVTNPIVLTWNNSTSPQTFTITPTIPASVVLTPTNSTTLQNPSPVVYTSLAYSLALSPLVLYLGTTTLGTFAGGGSSWLTNAPAFAAIGLSIGAATATTNTFATALVTVAQNAAVGIYTITDSTTLATANIQVAPFPQTWTYPSLVDGFPFSSTVGFAIYNDDGSIRSPRTTSGVYAVGTNACCAKIQLPFGPSTFIEWDDGLGHFVKDAVIIRGVESPSANHPQGLSELQVLASVRAATVGQTAAGQTQFFAPDNGPVRIACVLNGVDRTTITETPPV